MVRHIATPTIAPGTTGTYSGFPAVIVRQYDGPMYEVRVPGGLICVDIHDVVFPVRVEGK